MRLLPGTEINIYCQERNRERRWLLVGNVVVWVAVAVALLGLVASVNP